MFPRRFSARIAAGFSSAVLGLFVMGATAWRQVDNTLVTMRSVEHTDEVLEAAATARADLDDVEDGTHGYLLSGRLEFLEPVRRARSDLDEHLGRLRTLVSDNPAQVVRVDRLIEAAQHRSALAAQLVEDSRADPGAPRDDRAGEAAMKQALGALAELQAVEQQLLTERKAIATRAAQDTFRFIALSGLALLLLNVVGATWLIRSLTGQLARLADAARRIGRGEAPNLPPARHDEIGTVVAALEEMARLRRAAEERARRLLDDASEAYLLVAADGQVADVNRSACELLGYSREELLRLRNVDLVVPEERAELAQKRDQLSTVGSAIFERTMVHKSGRRISLELSAKLFGDGSLQVFARDVTRRRQREAEQAFLLRVGAVLSGSLDRAETLASVARELLGFLGDVCVLDLLEGDHFTRDVVACADPSKTAVAEALKPFPIDARRLRQTYPDLALLRPTLIARVTPELIRSAAVDPEHQRALEALGPRSTMAVPLVSRGAFIGVLTLVSTRDDRLFHAHDVELVEEVARRAAIAIDNVRLYRQSLDAVRNRDEVLHVVAHDLRNPLNTVGLLASTLARRRPEDERRKNARRSVDAIRNALGTANRLIEDLLDVTRLEGSAKLPLRKAVMPARDVLAEALELLRPNAEGVSVALESNLEALPPDAQVDVDRDRIVRVLSNLIGNSVKFTPRNGRVQLTATVSDAEMRVGISDTGPGIAAADLERVFQRFWQAKRDSGGGVGLGLSIARTIVEQHGGRLWAESVDGAGATFYFTLPLAAEAARPSIEAGARVKPAPP